MVETIDSEKLATAVNNTWEKLKQPQPLRVMAQVNTSREESECTYTRMRLPVGRQ